MRGMSHAQLERRKSGGFIHGIHYVESNLRQGLNPPLLVLFDMELDHLNHHFI